MSHNCLFLSSYINLSSYNHPFLSSKNCPFLSSHSYPFLFFFNLIIVRLSISHSCAFILSRNYLRFLYHIIDRFLPSHLSIYLPLHKSIFSLIIWQLLDRQFCDDRQMDNHVIIDRQLCDNQLTDNYVTIDRQAIRCR